MMRTALAPVVVLALLSWNGAGQETKDPGKVETGKVTAHSGGLHGYIGFSATRPPARSEYSAGMGFYSAVWPLIDQALADFQIGLAGSWITPDNSDNKDKPLAPEGTLARTWRERGPTWDSVFQTVEGGLGYWAGNHFRYGPPKFSMNATPQCYDYEVGSPGWSFFYSNEALPDNRLGIAQLSNRLLIPPDALPFQGNPHGQFLGYTWMALPFTEPTAGDPPTGDQSWTCFLSAANFKGPIAYFNSNLSPNGLFPQYYKHVGEERIAVAAADVPAETQLPAQEFKLAGRGEPYTSPSTGAWSRPGPKLGPFTVKLADGSLVTYSWYRFVDQPPFQQYDWSEEKKAKLQALVEKLHANWPIDRDYMAPPSHGSLVTLDPALLVTPPKGLEAGYVPIVTRQTTQ